MFTQFKIAVEEQYNSMSNGVLFSSNVSKDDIKSAYLSAFPAGSDPMFRERTTHDCSCCKNFVANLGRLLTIESGELVSVWDVEGLPYPYSEVAKKLSQLVKAAGINSVFFTKEKSYGLDHNFEKDGDDVKRWDHFHGKVPSASVTDCAGKYIGQHLNTYQVFKSSLDEATLDALDTVIELINAPADTRLYKGSEYLKAVGDWKSHKLRVGEAKTGQDLYLHQQCAKYGNSLKYKNTLIGMLVTDLSSGVDLVTAVSRYEAAAAPENYKRKSSPVTAGMKEKAVKDFEDMGVMPALHRRHAALSDISINNLIYADRTVKKTLGVLDVLDDVIVHATKIPKHLKEVDVDDFLQNYLPKATSVEVMLQGAHENNLMSVIAPVEADAKNILKWSSNYSWNYNGNVTDKMRDRVEKAGGSTEGVMRFSLSWDYADDLDIRCDQRTKRFGPEQISFQNKNSLAGGRLDVDANAQSRSLMPEPVENIVYKTNKNFSVGDSFCVWVENFQKRTSGTKGLNFQYHWDGVDYNYVYDLKIPNKGRVKVLDIVIGKDLKPEIRFELPGRNTGSVSKHFWGVSTNCWTKLSAVMLSPNHWDGQTIGNKHWFFILDGCKNPEPCRGLYNEFLSGELQEHGKLLEMLGDKLKVDPSDQQLSGVGFSSTIQNELLCKLTGQTNQVIKIKF